jgi:carbon monoxide dehydrogenase subunit G
VKAQGALARLGSRLLGGAAKLMAGQFFKAMEQQVKERVVR